MYPREADGAVAWAAAQSRARSRNWHNDCLMFVRMCLNVASCFPSAEKGYYGTAHRHTSWPPPEGVPVWWTNGRYGHVALSAGGGFCYSTDFLRSGSVDKVKIASITVGWGHRYRGWSEDINGVRVYRHVTPPKKPTAPELSASAIAHAATRGEDVARGHVLKKAVMAEVGRGHMDMGSSHLGAAFRTQYALVQRRYLKAAGLKVTAKATDGIPGADSLRWLGTRHGFTVTK